jgi:hypothetical protein
LVASGLETHCIQFRYEGPRTQWCKGHQSVRLSWTES